MLSQAKLNAQAGSKTEAQPTTRSGKSAKVSIQEADDKARQSIQFIPSAIAACGSSVPCHIIVPPELSISSPRPCSWWDIAKPIAGEGCRFNMQPNVTVTDYRFGIYQTNVDGVGIPGTNYQPWQRLDSIFTKSLDNDSPFTLKVLQSSNVLALNGGVNIGQNNYSNKTYYVAQDARINAYTPGQKVGFMSFLNNHSVGDVLPFYGIATCDGGFSAASDETCEGMDIQANQNTVEYTGTVSALTDQIVKVAVSAGAGTQGAGRYLVNESRAIKQGSIEGIVNPSSPSRPLHVRGAGTHWPVSSVQTTLSTDIAKPGRTSVLVANGTGLTAKTNVCVVDPYAYEQVRPASVDKNRFVADFRYPHKAGALVTAGGLCGYFLSFTADIATPADFNSHLAYQLQTSLHYVVPVIRSTSGQDMDVWLQSGNLGYQSYRGRWGPKLKGYTLYPGAEVTSVVEGQSLSDSLTLEVPVSFAPGDSVFLPHYHNLNVVAALHHVQRVFPQMNSGNTGAWWLTLDGMWTDWDTAMSVINNTPPEIYANGKERPVMFHTGGVDSQPWKYYFYSTKPASSAFMMFDNPNLIAGIVWQPSLLNGIGFFQSNPVQHRFEFGNKTTGTQTTFDWSTGGATFNGTLSAAKGLQLATTGPQPSCSSSVRGQFWTVQGGTGVNDKTYQCMKDASEKYIWKQLL